MMLRSGQFLLVNSLDSGDIMEMRCVTSLVSASICFDRVKLLAVRVLDSLEVVFLVSPIKDISQ